MLMLVKRCELSPTAAVKVTVPLPVLLKVVGAVVRPTVLLKLTAPAPLLMLKLCAPFTVLPNVMTPLPLLELMVVAAPNVAAPV